MKQRSAPDWARTIMTTHQEATFLEKVARWQEWGVSRGESEVQGVSVGGSGLARGLEDLDVVRHDRR